MNKRLIKNSHIVEERQIPKKSTLQVESSSSDESDKEDQNNKFSRFQIIDENEKKQGKIDNYFQPGKIEQPAIQPKKQSKVIEINMMETNIQEESKEQSFHENIESDEDSFIDFSHLANITRNQVANSQNTTKSEVKIIQPIISAKKEVLEPIAENNQNYIEEQHIEIEEEQQNLLKPLAGKEYLILGNSDNMSKQQLEAIIKHYGGIIKAKIFKRVTLIAAEYYEVNNRKKHYTENQYYKESQKYNNQVLTYQDFNTYFKQLTNMDLQQSLPFVEKEIESKVEMEIPQQPQSLSKVAQIQQKEIKNNLLSKFENDVVLIEQPVQINPQIVNLSKSKSLHEEVKQQKQENIIKEEKVIKHQLWTTKYAPNKVSDCLDQTHVPTIVKWLDNWGKSQLEILPGSFQSYNLSAKALLLSGPPGIGKTTIIRLISKQKQYQLIEWNASDVRSKLQIENYVKHLQDNTVLRFKDSNLISEGKTIILMDEVDGMTGSDKGGNKCLIDMIKLTKVPIVCICNDRNKQSMRTLANYCLDLQFKKPNSDEIFRKLEYICKNEDISYEPKELKQQIDVSQCDVRQLLNMLQMHKVGLKLHIDKNIGKDTTVTSNAFDTAKILLSYKDAEKLHLNKLMEYYFQDPDITQLLYQENYLDTKRSPANSIGTIAQAASSLAEADVLNTKVRSQMWGLMPNAGFLSTMYPTQLLKSNLFGKVQFPQFFGKISSENKMKRQIQEVKESFAESTILTSSKAIQSQYIEPFAFIVIKNLSSSGMVQINEIVTLLRNYKVNVAQFEECIVGSLALFPKRDVFAEIPTNVKTTLNKTYKEHMDSADRMNKEKRGVVQGQTYKKQRMEDDLGEEEQDDEQEEVKTKKVAQNKKEPVVKQKNKEPKQTALGKKKGKKAKK